MKRMYLILPQILFMVTMVEPVTAMSTDQLEGSAVDTLVKGNTDFAIKLYRELQQSEGNLLFSPYSISTALGMTYAGARENTAEEMKVALNFELDQSQLHSAFKELNRVLQPMRAKPIRS